MSGVLKAFDRISGTCIGVVGDDCKDDLILLATNAGITEQQLHEKFPKLYERGIDNTSKEEFENDAASDSMSEDEEPINEELAEE